MRTLAHNRKGIFFTIIAIILVTVLSVAFVPTEQATFKDRLPAVKSRVSMANDYVKNIRYSYLGEALQTSGRDAMVAMVLYANKTTYFSDYNAVSNNFTELMLNGTINGKAVEDYLGSNDASYSVMRGRTFFHKLGAIENASRDTLLITTSFKRNLSDYTVIVYQSNETGPWRIGVNLTTQYFINASLSSWDITQTVSTTFPIEGLLDPVYLINASRFNNMIIRTNSTVWNISNVSKLIEDQRYKEDSTAPSFLMRLYYNMSSGSGSACCGIESPVNPNRLNIDKCTRKSYIDWCFFGPNCAPDAAGEGKIWNITGITTYTPGGKFYGFKLDTSHAASYNITSSTTGEMGTVSC